MKTLSIVAFATVFVASSLVAIGQQTNHEKHQATTKSQSATSMSHCKQMMADKEKMRTHVIAMDNKLDDLVIVMERKSGNDKADAVADVVREMVTQRRMMNVEMAKMDAKMMDHMMQHMSSGTKMANCPMMKGMKMGK